MIMRFMFVAVITTAATVGGATSSAATAGTTPTRYSPPTCSVPADCFTRVRSRDLHHKREVCRYCRDKLGNYRATYCHRPEDELRHPEKPGPIKR